jgi:hypothetical protein
MPQSTTFILTVAVLQAEERTGFCFPTTSGAPSMARLCAMGGIALQPKRQASASSVFANMRICTRAARQLAAFVLPFLPVSLSLGALLSSTVSGAKFSFRKFAQNNARLCHTHNEHKEKARIPQDWGLFPCTCGMAKEKGKHTPTPSHCETVALAKKPLYLIANEQITGRISDFFHLAI